MTAEGPSTLTLVPQRSLALTLVSAHYDLTGAMASEWGLRAKQELCKWRVREDWLWPRSVRNKDKGMKSQEVLHDQQKEGSVCQEEEGDGKQSLS